MELNASSTADRSPDNRVVEAAPRSSMRGDLFASYIAAGTRIAAWAIVSAIVYRLAGVAEFGTLALIRGTIGILTYTAVGLAPTLVRLFAEAIHGNRRADSTPLPLERMEYEPHRPSDMDERTIFSTGVMVASASALVGLLIAVVYALMFNRLHLIPISLHRQASWAVVLIGGGTLLRLFSDVPGAVLQTRGRIALDNYLLAATDAAWAAATLLLIRAPGLLTASITFAAAAVFLVIVRSYAVARLSPTPWPPAFALARRPIARRMLSFGAILLLAQLADYFYAPTDYILINHFFGSGAEAAAYAPGVQLDTALLMLVNGMAAVLLPSAALAHAAGHIPEIRRYFIRGTLASTALLTTAALGVWFLYPVIFHLWFGAHPPNTRPILHLVLIGTVIGGSSSVGRSVLIGIGRVRAFTLAAILAGVVNVIASYGFVRYGRLGLPGILYGTVLAVAGRCAIWMPWYVLRTLRREEQLQGQNAPKARE